MPCPATLLPVDRPTSAATPYARAGTEPTLEDVLNDPLVHLILERDGLDRTEVRDRMTRAAAMLRRKNGGPRRG